MKGDQLEVRRAGGDLGGTMRLGAFEARLNGNSRIASAYGTSTISERHRHRYEVNTAYRERLEKAGLVFTGMSPDGLLPETVEYPDHPWFIGVQYHPELKSRPFEPHPLFKGFIAPPWSRAGWCEGENWEERARHGVANLFSLNVSSDWWRIAGRIYVPCNPPSLCGSRSSRLCGISLGVGMSMFKDVRDMGTGVFLRLTDL